MIKRKIMFEKLLIVIFFLLNESSFYTSIALFFRSFFSFFSFFSPRQLFKQLSYFFSTTTTFRSKISFFPFCRFIFFLLSTSVTQSLIRKLFTHVFILKRFISKQFDRFFLSRKSLFSTFFFVFCRCSDVWNSLSFDVFFLFSNSMILIENIRIWCSFMLSSFREKNSLIRFSVFRERCFALKFFYFLPNQKILFLMCLKNFSTRSSMWKNEMCVRKNWWWIKNK